jgi:hypothetical protein
VRFNARERAIEYAFMEKKVCRKKNRYVKKCQDDGEQGRLYREHNYQYVI